jgi:hypothetical protein
LRFCAGTYLAGSARLAGSKPAMVSNGGLMNSVNGDGAGS